MKFEFRGKEYKWMVRKTMYLDETKPENILMNYYDLAHTFFLVEYEMEDMNPKDGQVIFDCGAAQGDTLVLFRALYPNSEIHSFESESENIEMIKNNIELNNIKNAIINEAFLYSDSKKHFMDLSTFKINDNKQENGVRKIQTLALDDYVKNNDISNIGLIKFDIEGGEQDALIGAIETIKAQKPLLYIPIYHLPSDIYAIPEYLRKLDMPMEFKLKWTEKKCGEWTVFCL